VWQLSKLRDEYEVTKKYLAFPLTSEDCDHLRERRDVILAEAQALAASLDIRGSQWFNIE